MKKVSRLNRENGVALITAMLVVTLATILAVGMTSRQQIDIRRTGNILNLEQLRIYLMAVEDHADPLLAKYWKDIEFISQEEYEKYTAISDFGYQEQIEGGYLKVSLSFDEQGRFNINSLLKNGAANAERVAQFRRLLHLLEIDNPPVDAIIDWLDSNADITYPDGAEDNFYLALEQPYRSADRAMVDISELMLVKGVDQEMFNKLSPYITVLPEGSRMNINWMGSEQFMSLHADITQEDADRLIEERDSDSFKSVDAFLQHASLANKNIDKEQLTVSNNYFMLHTTIELGQLKQTYQTQLMRTAENHTQVIKRARKLF